MSERLYKFLNADLEGPCVGERWGRPGADGEPGSWVESTGPLAPGDNGVHCLSTAEGVIYFVYSWQAALWSELWEVEPDGDSMESNRGPMLVCRRARLIRGPLWGAATCRLLAADLAALALPEWLAIAPDDPRPGDAIDAARAFVLGDVDAAALEAAGQAAFLASIGPTGHRAWWGGRAVKARAAALAAARSTGSWAPDHTPTALVKAVIPAVLDAGVPWDAAVARCGAYL